MKEEAINGFRKRLELFGPISNEEWSRTEDHLSLKTFGKMDFLQSAGEQARNMYYIHKGLLRVYYTRNNKEFIRQFFFENGMFVDYQSIFSNEPSSLYAQILEPSQILVIPWVDAIRLTERNPSLKSALDYGIKDAYVYLSRRLEAAFIDSPEEMYLDILKREKVLQRIPQYMIASYLGITPEGLSKLKRRLKNNNNK